MGRLPLEFSGVAWVSRWADLGLRYTVASLLPVFTGVSLVLEWALSLSLQKLASH